MGKLTAAEVKAWANDRKPMVKGDGGRLYFQISKGGSASWIFRYEREGRQKWFGLGPYSDVSLSKAREQAELHRAELRQGLCPMTERERKKAAYAEALSVLRTFESVAGEYMAGRLESWTPKHAKEWRNSLNNHVYPKLGHRKIQDITLTDVEGVVKPLFASKRETAVKISHRIRMVWEFALSHEWVSGDNPARWAGGLKERLGEHALTKTSKRAKKVKHHAALPYQEIPEFMAELAALDGIAPRALEFLVATASRTRQVILTEWNELDMNNQIWCPHWEHTKTGIDPQVPLNAVAVAAIERQLVRGSEYVFPSDNIAKPLSDGGMSSVIKKRLGRKGFTVHGFRSSFADWAGEQQAHIPKEVAEKVLSHSVEDRTERAYRRTSQFDLRKTLLDSWSDYIWGKNTKADVLPLRRNAR